MFVVVANLVALVVLLLVCHGWLGARVEQMIRETALRANEQRSMIQDFNATMTNMPPVDGD